MVILAAGTMIPFEATLTETRFCRAARRSENEKAPKSLHLLYHQRNPKNPQNQAIPHEAIADHTNTIFPECV